MNAPSSDIAGDKQESILGIFGCFLRLGLTSFGGPIAHLGYFRDEFVARRRWLDEHAYAELVALCQFLPGPASSQVGMALGLSRGGIPGALAAFLGFTLPSAIALVLFALGISHFGNQLGSGWLHGLKVVAVAVVAQALWGMGKSVAPDKQRATLAVAAAVIASLVPSAFGQVGVIVVSGLIGWAFLRSDAALPHTSLPVPIRRVTGACLLGAFFLLLFGLPFLADSTSSYVVKLFDSFYRAGSLVFGGGHVVLPLLQSQVVPAGWVSNDAFLAGYGAAQAVPGPLFTFAAYLGAVSTQSPSGWAGATIALAGIFLPAFLLIVGTLPFWESLRRYAGIKRAMLGINAAVVGILLAAFYHPVWTSAITSATDFCLAAAAFLLLVFWKTPPWLVVLLTAAFASLAG
ncbi:chromate efflux transporter [Massilia horti]|uniref:Chromate efflux transporter n=1 Tax=Massilia horti TaxID=2562153 RepID=A0A4Y9SWX9_9BURK|nr:chromate efflux transporter [Massilia horti]TFW29153.1 chromate efflux transporter [Massilia horti]